MMWIVYNSVSLLATQTLWNLRDVGEILKQCLLPNTDGVTTIYNKRLFIEVLQENRGTTKPSCTLKSRKVLKIIIRLIGSNWLWNTTLIKFVGLERI